MGLHIKNGVHYGSGPNKASQLSIVDTEGIIGNAGSTVTTQALVDGIADDLKEYEVVPSKNLFDIPDRISSQTIPNTGITATVVRNVNGRIEYIEMDGTLSGDAAGLTLVTYSIDGDVLNTGRYKLIGNPGAEHTELRFYNPDGQGGNHDDTGNGVIVDYVEGSAYNITIILRGNGNVFDHVRFKPMITTDLNATIDDYEPYYLPVKDAMWTKEQQRKNGAYNLYKVGYGSQTVGQVSMVVSNDGIVTINTNGALTEDWYTELNYSTDRIPLSANTYKLVGCPVVPNQGAKWVLKYIYYRSGGYLSANDTGAGCPFTLDGTETQGWCRIELKAGANGTYKFKPMITTDLNATYDDYVPYAKTNRELTEDIKITTYTRTTDNTGECSIGSDSAYVPIGGSIVGTQNTHTGAISFRTASNDRNTYYAMFYSATSSALNVVANKELTFIVVWLKKA